MEIIEVITNRGNGLPQTKSSEQCHSRLSRLSIIELDKAKNVSNQYFLGIGIKFREFSLRSIGKLHYFLKFPTGLGNFS